MILYPEAQRPHDSVHPEAQRLDHEKVLQEITRSQDSKLVVPAAQHSHIDIASAINKFTAFNLMTVSRQDIDLPTTNFLKNSCR